MSECLPAKTRLPLSSRRFAAPRQQSSAKVSMWTLLTRSYSCSWANCRSRVTTCCTAPSDPPVELIETDRYCSWYRPISFRLPSKSSTLLRRVYAFWLKKP